MSKLYDIYLSLKHSQKDSDRTLYLFKSGMFFIFIDHDAIIASSILNLKITKLNDTVVKCGFPISSLDKFSKILESSKYTLQIIDSNSNISYSLADYKTSNSINALLTDINSINLENLSVGEAFSFLEKLKKDVTYIFENNSNIFDK